MVESDPMQGLEAEVESYIVVKGMSGVQLVIESLADFELDVLL